MTTVPTRLLILAVVAAGIMASACGGGARASAPPVRPARFARYVDREGRVVRIDQGGDTVSEGQSYGLLIAVATGDRATFATVWAWTAGHLQRPDGLLAYHWQNGRVADAMPATDADLNTAWALAVAATRFRNPAYDRAARRMASAILDNETDTVRSQLVLVAGPWARPDPATVNPSYFSPAAFGALMRLTGDRRWDELARSSRAVLETLAGAPRALPPDWASIGAGGPRATPAPGAGSPVQYGLDAARAPVWYASACTKADRDLAAAWWTTLADAASARQFPISSDLAGHPTTDLTNPLAAVADAAAAAAAGDARSSADDLARAEALDDAHPTYYGGAWVVLGEIVLRTSNLGGCPPL